MYRGQEAEGQNRRASRPMTVCNQVISRRATDRENNFNEP
jgi:hypothetical protein